MADNLAPFWQTTTLEEMTSKQWESLCDGCGQCCLHRFEDEESGEIIVSEVACFMLEVGSCRCKDYANRLEVVPGCAALSPKTARTWTWLPETCAYRKIARGEELDWWHPLVSGSAETVHEAGISIRGRAVSENDVIMEALVDALTGEEED